MKKNFRFGILVITGLLFAGFLSACSQDYLASVKSYNNSIVQIQKDMLAQAQDASKVFEQPHVDQQVILSTLQGIRAGINASHDKFRAMVVPAKAQQLADAMERFFTVETNGIQNIIAGVQQVQGKQSDLDAMKAFSDTFTQFSSQENASLKDFYATQQQIAQEYGQQVIQVE